MKLRAWIVALIAIALLVSFSTYAATALDLHQARSSGLVGEKLDGFVQAMQSTPDVNNLVANVNARRQQEYTAIATQKGQPVDVVAKLAAQQIISTLDHGCFYQNASGNWVQR